MTNTAMELINSSAFWKGRIEEQYDYITTFASVARTRPDKLDVFQSALDILEFCQFMYLSAYILEETGEFLPEEEVRRIFNDHVNTWNATSFRTRINKEVEHG